MEQAVTITDNQIVIRSQFFIHKDYSFTRRDLLVDLLARHYRGQQICVQLWDGENSEFSGFNTFMQWLCDHVNVDPKDIIYESHCSQEPFECNHLKLGIFISVNQYLKHFEHKVDDAKFVGTLLGRFNISRLRLAYELDHAFPDNNFITFQPTPDFVAKELQYFSDSYKDEMAWLNTKLFDRDLTSSHYMGMIDWKNGCSSYHNVANRYQIEVVSETDSYSNHWFTEKTANCLATGKPFLLLSGPGSLQQLQNFGFRTFEEIIDESYDQACNPVERISRLTQSLKTLYNSNDRLSLVKSLYTIASENIEIYKEFSKR